MITNVKIVMIQVFKPKFCQYFVFIKKYSNHLSLLHQFNLYVLLTCGKNLVMIEINLALSVLPLHVFLMNETLWVLYNG